MYISEETRKLNLETLYGHKYFKKIEETLSEETRKLNFENFKLNIKQCFFFVCLLSNKSSFKLLNNFSSIHTFIYHLFVILTPVTY